MAWTSSGSISALSSAGYLTTGDINAPAANPLLVRAVFSSANWTETLASYILLRVIVDGMTGRSNKIGVVNLPVYLHLELPIQYIEDQILAGSNPLMHFAILRVVPRRGVIVGEPIIGVNMEMWA